MIIGRKLHEAAIHSTLIINLCRRVAVMQTRHYMLSISSCTCTDVWLTKMNCYARNSRKGLGGLRDYYSH